MKNEPPSPAPPPDRPREYAGRFWKATVGLLLIVVGSVFVDYLWSSYRRAAVMDAWVEVPCRIESIGVDDSGRNQRGLPKYTLELSYRYEYGGESRVGKRLKRLPTEASDLRKLKGKLEKYAAGSTVVCHVDPADPAAAVLEKDTKAALYTIWFPFLFILGGAGMILSAVFRRTRE